MSIEHLADGVTLYCGDCREVLPTLPKVDAVVTDPPYGISYQRGASRQRPVGQGRKTIPACNDAPIIGDDRPFDPSPWLAFDEAIFWGADHYSSLLPHGRWLAWDKLAGHETWDDFSDVEFAWHSKRGAARLFSLLWKGLIKQGVEKSAGGRERWHPTQKPIALMEWCILELKGPAKTILDPFVGSGTTGVAAVKLGRSFIGIEIEPKYFDIACRRISQALAQPDLFIDMPKPIAKEELLL